MTTPLDGDDADHMHQVARLAQQLTAMMILAAQDEGTLLNWQDVCFAAALSMKAVGSVTADVKRKRNEVDDVDEQLSSLFGMAMQQPVEAKRFASRKDMEAWLAEMGFRQEAPPAGVRH